MLLKSTVNCHYTQRMHLPGNTILQLSIVDMCLANSFEASPSLFAAQRDWRPIPPYPQLGNFWTAPLFLPEFHLFLAKYKLFCLSLFVWLWTLNWCLPRPTDFAKGKREWRSSMADKTTGVLAEGETLRFKTLLDMVSSLQYWRSSAKSGLSAKSVKLNAHMCTSVKGLWFGDNDDRGGCGEEEA